MISLTFKISRDKMTLLFIIINAAINMALCDVNLDKYIAYCDGPQVPKWIDDDIYFSRIMDSHIYGYENRINVIPCCINLKWFSTLPSDQQTISWYYQKENSETRELITDKSNETGFKVMKEDGRFLQVKLQDNYEAVNFLCEFSDGRGSKINYSTTFEVTLQTRKLYTQDKSGEYEFSSIKVGEKKVQKYCTIFLKYETTIEALWYRKVETNNNITFEVLNNTNIKITLYPYIYSNTVGALLYINEVTPDLEGYVFECRDIKNSKNTNYNVCVITKEDYKDYIQISIPTGIVIITVVCFIIILYTIFKYYKLDTRLYIKNKFSSSTVQENLTYDVYICYAEDSQHFIKDFVLKSLNNFNCYVWEINEPVGSFLPTSCQKSLEESYTFLLILSEKLLDDNLSILMCQSALVLAQSSKIRIVTLVPENKNEILKNVTEKSAVLKLLCQNFKTIKLDRNYSLLGNASKTSKELQLYCQRQKYNVV